ncbi:MAG: hypothetical protein AVDCRST_MAG24-1750 [uncultured Nocardioidaceae bacterium]|uniref:Uncharacterized protein n=1 Tax=uncultured Nocardioidaceae bacterium TaxID=253824 RepID=A0A6J4M728_9ACTN|nr:MAG: hypothetical protein AVDCRST_MAG24-1750 [uncultured Nocardioidaceae bacterium]
MVAPHRHAATLRRARRGAADVRRTPQRVEPPTMVGGSTRPEGRLGW